MQQVRGGVISPDCLAAVSINGRRRFLSSKDLTRQCNSVSRQTRQHVDRVEDLGSPRRGRDQARIANLSATFCIKRCLVEKELRNPILSAPENGDDSSSCFIVIGRSANEHRLALGTEDFSIGGFVSSLWLSSSSTCSLPLSGHLRLKSSHVDGYSRLGCQFNRQLDRKAMRIVQSEGI